MKWNKMERNLIWKDYVENKMWNIFEEDDVKIFDLKQEAPCPFCGKIMLKAQYQGVQPDKKHSWNVDHIYGKERINNHLDNLQPMHPWCNAKKDSSD